MAFYCRFHHNGHCYRIFLNHATWMKAESQCQCDGGHLSSVLDDEEAGFLGNIATQTGSKSWLGLTYQFNETFQWSDGSETTFTNWKNGNEPNEPNACALIKASFNEEWVSGKCVENRRFVCKVPEFKPSKRELCVSFSNRFNSLFDGNFNSCVNLSQIYENRANLIPEFNINRSCLNKCSTEVRFIVTVRNAYSCKNIPMYSKIQLDCGLTYWMRCHSVGDHLNAASQCEILCHYRLATENCTLTILYNQFLYNRRICEINLL